MTTLVYYNGVQYEIENEAEIEDQTNLPPEFEESNENIGKVTCISRDFKESVWTPQALQLFLNECIKRKLQIRDPNAKIHKTFFAIHKALQTKGFIFKAISLERKLRSMKRHFFFLCESNRNPIMKRSHWPYYNSMKKIFGDCAPRESEPPVVEIETDKDKHQTEPSTFLNSESVCLKQKIPLVLYNSCEKGMHQSENHKYFGNPANMSNLRKQILYLEERRTVAAEKIVHELRRSNKLKLEMLDINKKIFEAEKDDEYYY